MGPEGYHYRDPQVLGGKGATWGNRKTKRDESYDSRILRMMMVVYELRDLGQIG